MTRSTKKRAASDGLGEPRARVDRNRKVNPTGGAHGAKGELRLAAAARRVAEYDFERAEADLAALARDAAETGAVRAKALFLLMELHTDHLANDSAALDLEPALLALGPLTEEAHEILGVAAARSGDVSAALRHLKECRSERTAQSLASLARACVEAGAWSSALDAWAQLQALVAKAESAFVPPLAAARDLVRRHLEVRASCASAREIAGDDALERFVRTFAPEHPWLRERRESAQKLRAQTSVRALLERATTSVRRSDLAGVERALELLVRAPPTSSEEAARVDELAAWVEARRAESHAARALALAAKGDDEAACRAYAALPARARATLCAASLAPIFFAFEALLRAFPESPNARWLLRAAAAWSAAQRSVEEPDRWALLAPHAATLERAPELAAGVRLLRSRSWTEPAPVDALSPAPPPPPREVRVDGVRFTDASESSSGSAEPIDVAPYAMRVGTGTYVATLEAVGERGAWQVSLRLPSLRAPSRCIRVEGPPSFQPRRLVTTSRRALLVDEGGAVFALALSPHLAVQRLDLGAAIASGWTGDVIAVDEDVLAFGLGTEGASPSAWRLVDTRNQSRLVDLEGEGLYINRGPRGAAMHRVSGSRVEKLDASGGVVRYFELPRGVSPLAVVEAPFKSSPVVVSGSTSVLAWWQPEKGFFRAFELYDPIVSGALIDAVTIADRCVCIVTRSRHGSASLHYAVAEKQALRPGGPSIKVAGYLRLVLDPSGRRAWSVLRAAEGEVEIRSLSVPDEPTGALPHA